MPCDRAKLLDIVRHRAGMFCSHLVLVLLVLTLYYIVLTEEANDKYGTCWEICHIDAFFKYVSNLHVLIPFLP